MFISSFRFCFTAALILSLVVVDDVVVNAQAADTNEMCAEWAAMGECDRNPAYMKPNCATSCHKVAMAAAEADEELNKIQSFFDLSSKDINGKTVNFEQFRGQVTILTNVASYCGYTDSHYKGLVELWGHVKNENVNILAFPCNQFGKQEPGTADEIQAFAKSKGVQFTLMTKVDVNGPDADIVYKYLKKEAGVSFIQWNFATYFVVAPDGTVTAHNGVEPMDLLEYSLGLLKEEL